MRVRDRSYTKKSPFPIIEVFKPKLQKGKVTNGKCQQQFSSHKMDV